jgi:hypothetical protein
MFKRDPDWSEVAISGGCGLGMLLFFVWAGLAIGNLIYGR